MSLDVGRRQVAARQQRRRVGRQRVPHAGHLPDAVALSGAGDDDPGLCFEPRDVAVESLPSFVPLVQPVAAEHEEQQGQRPEERRQVLFGGRALALADTAAVARRRRRSSASSPAKLCEWSAPLVVDRRQRRRARVPWSVSGGVPRMTAARKASASLLAPQNPISQTQRVEAGGLAATERVPDEVLDGAEHSRNELRILARGVVCRDVTDEEAALLVDQEEVLDAVDERVAEHHVCERRPGATRLDPPQQPSPREAVLERLIEGLERTLQSLRDRLADGGAHHRRRRCR